MTQESAKIVLHEETPAIRRIAGVLTAVIALVGVTEKGPIGVPQLVSSVEDYRRYFGGYVADGAVAQAVDGIFQNVGGGVQVYVSRVVHVTDPDNPLSKTSAAATKDLLTAATAPSAGASLGSVVGPFALDNGLTLLVNIDAGGNATATFTAAAAARTSGNGPFDLANNDTLTVSLNGGAVQTITFVTANFANIDAATAAEVAAVINGQLVGGQASVVGAGVRITSDRKGTGSGVNVTGGTANAVLAFTTGNVAGTGNVSNAAAVTVAEVKTIVEAAVAGCTVDNVGGAVRIRSNTTGAGSSVLVDVASTADDELGLDNATHTGLSGAAVNTLRVDAKYDGVYGNGLSVKISAATSGDAARFNLSVLRSGVEVERFANLSMVDTDGAYVETVVNHATTGSANITVTDLDAATPSPNDRPNNGTFGPLTGGGDGLVGLADTDFIGGSGANGKTGMRALDRVQGLSLLAVPGRATPAMHLAMVSYCEVSRAGSIFPVLDPPADLSAAAVAEYVTTTAGLLELSEFASMYWPRIKVLNPSKSVFGNGETIIVAPSGHVLGVMARTDASKEGGVYEAPAGVNVGVLQGCMGFESDETLEESARDIVAAARINPLTTGRGQPRYIDGHDTLKASGNFPSVPERRGVIFIRESVKDGLQSAKHRNNTEELRAEVTRAIEAFLVVQTRHGAFRSKDPAKAFYVDFGRGLNPDSAVFAGKLYGKIGLATNKPIQTVDMTFTQDTRALDETAV